MVSIVEILETLEKKPKFHYEFNQRAYLNIIFVLHELESFGIIISKLEIGKNKERYDQKFYITELGKQLLRGRRAMIKEYIPMSKNIKSVKK